MRFGSLFAGIGGFDLGFERAGMECLYQVEIDAACRRVLSHHWPDVKRFKDVRDVGAVGLPEVDLLCGGFPCQDVSVAGRRAGLNGARSGLFYEFVRIVGEHLPAWVVIENVPGLLSSRRGRDMGAVLGPLAELGYGFAYRVLDAQYFGVPQRRRRVFIVGCLGDDDGACQVLLDLQSLRGDPTPRRETPQTAAASSGASAHRRGGVAPSISQSLTAHHGRHDHTTDTYVSTYRIATRPHAAHEAERWQVTEVASTLNPWNMLRDPPPHVVTCLTGTRNHALRAEGADASEDGTGRGTPITCVAAAPDTTLGPESSVIIDAVRRLTPRECERLQGFPDDWTAGESDAQRYRQLGNAVCVPVAEWIAKRLVAVEQRAVMDVAA